MIIFPQGSPIIKNLSVAILQLSEAGELAYLRSKWWASSCIADKGKASAVQPHNLKGMFLVLALGLGLGTLAAVLELTFKSRRSAAEHKVRASVSSRVKQCVCVCLSCQILNSLISLLAAAVLQISHTVLLVTV